MAFFVWLLACVILGSPFVTSSTPGTNRTTGFQLNCSGNPTDRMISCDKNCINGNHSWVIQAPYGRRVLLELEPINNRRMGFRIMDMISNKTSQIRLNKNLSLSSPMLSLSHQLQLWIWRVIAEVYDYPVKFNLKLNCYEESSSVILVDGPSPLEGLVFLEPDRYVCYDGFNDKAAELICGELGFPAVEGCSTQRLPGKTALIETQRLTCSQDSLRVKDCSLTTIRCSSDRIARLKCREPGYLGCYFGDNQTFQALPNPELQVDSYEECASTCRRLTVLNSIAAMHEKKCTCLKQTDFYNFISTCSTCFHYWECLIKGDNFHFFFKLSAAVCGPPDHVSNGNWSSNIMRFGSVITLTCREGYVINGSATLQCVGRPGWSTYFPVWNASVPSCQPVEQTTIGDNQTTLALTTSANSEILSAGTKQQDESTRTESTQMKDNSSDQQTILEVTTSVNTYSSSTERQNGNTRTTATQTTDKTPGNEWQGENMKTTSARITGNTSMTNLPHETTVITNILGISLCVALVLLVVLAVIQCKNHQKARRLSETLNQMNHRSNDEEIHMHPVGNSSQSEADTVNSLRAISTEYGAIHHSFRYNPDNRFGEATSHQEDPYHIYQEAKEVEKHYTLETEMNTDIDVSGQADSILQPFRDVFHQDQLEDRDDAQLQSTADSVEKELYTDMSDNVKERIKRNATIVQSRDISAIAEDTDEDGYLLSHVSSRNVTGNKSNTGCSTMDTCDIGSVPFCGDVTNNASSIHSSCRNLIDCARSGNLQSLMYEEIPSHSEQSARSQEQRYCRKNSIVAENEACLPFAMGLNDPLYSVSIYSSKQTVEPSVEVDENGFLVLETTDTGEIVGDQLCVSKDTATFSGTSLYENEVSPETDRHRAYNPKDRCNSKVYESIAVT